MSLCYVYVIFPHWGRNAFQNIIVYVTEGAAPVEPEEVNDDIYDSESEDENEYEEIVMI